MKDFLKIEDIAKLDFFKSMLWNFNLPSELQKNLITQSMQGHIISGHGLFKGEAIPDTFIEDVYKILKRDSKDGRKRREEEIIEVFDLADRLAKGQTNQLLKSDGTPILGFEPFKDYKIKSLEKGLKGAAIMGCVDDKFWRADTINIYRTTLEGRPLNIGYGKEYLIDMNELKNKRITLEDLSQKAHSKEDIKQLRKDGIIVRNGGKNIENLFIRQNEGLGCCDDLMITSIGLIHGKDAMILAWALDALDTYTKFVLNPKESGYDQILSKRIQEKWAQKNGELLARPEEIREIIYLGAKENYPVLNLSSSHRRFIQTEKGQNTPTIFNHIKYVETGERPKDYGLGFTKVSSDRFYDTLEKRFILHNKENLLPTERLNKKTKK